MNTLYNENVPTNTIQQKYTGAKADASDEEPQEEICFSVNEGKHKREVNEKNRWHKLV